MEFLNGGILFLTYCEPAAMQFVKKVANMYDLTHPKRPAYPSKVDLETRNTRSGKEMGNIAYTFYSKKVIVRERDCNPIIICMVSFRLFNL